MDKIYNHQINEQEAQKKWESEQTYSQENNPGPLYNIDTPPPTVSGSLHIGHVFSYTQTDIIARYKRMSGFSVFYPMGFDDNGLPTERFVEKKRNIVAHHLSRSEFIKICLTETQIVEEQFKELWQKIGLSVDWRHWYSTISDSTRKISQESFIRLYKKGYIYRKHEPALYCTTCRTSVAQAELDGIEVSSHFNDIVFNTEEGDQVVIGTTRPELLASCVALLYNPKDERYKHLKGKNVIVPIFEHSVPVLEDESVDIEKGTGLVMCCTFGDKTDIEWYKKFKLPYRQSVGFDGRWTEITGPLVGLKVHDARKKILELLEQHGSLKNQRPINHAVNVHERCKKEIEYIEIPQWFIKILDYKKEFIKLADEINWYPSFMKSRYVNWVENLSWDWGISRQRFFGIPFPVWHCVECKEVLLPEIKDLPIDPQETDYPGNCPKCLKDSIIPDKDVMDTWNTSSLTPMICYNLWNPKATSVFEGEEIRNFIPMSMRPQAHDIIRTWAFDTIVKSWMHFNTIPWKDIVISGHVLSPSKEKISKSKENNPMIPENLLKQYPADVIRFWTASGSLGQDVMFSENQLKIGGKLVNKLWNAFRFSREHLANYEYKQEQSSPLGIVNEWILHKASETFENYKKYLDQHEYNLALNTVEKFFWADFCDNYLELIKNQLFNPDQYKKEEVNATLWTLNNVGLRILQLYAPYLPFITETIYELMYKTQMNKPSIHQIRFSDVQKIYKFGHCVEVMEKIIELISQVRKLKSENQMSLKAEIDTLIIYSEDKSLLDDIKRNEQLIRGITHAVKFDYQNQKIEAVLEKVDEKVIARVSLN